MISVSQETLVKVYHLCHHHFNVVPTPAEKYGLSSLAPMFANPKTRTGLRKPDAAQPSSSRYIHHSKLEDLLKAAANIVKFVTCSI